MSFDDKNLSMIELTVILNYIPTWRKCSFEEKAPPMRRVFEIILVFRIVNDQAHYKQIDCKRESHQISSMCYRVITRNVI